MNISLEFQEFVLVVVAPLVYQGCAILITLSIFVAVAMPLLEIGRIFRRHQKNGI